MLCFGVLCLGVHGTWKAGGVNVGTRAVGAVSGRKEPVVFWCELQWFQCLKVSSSVCWSPCLRMGTMRVEFNSSGRRLHLGQGIGVKSWGFCV